MLVLLQTYAGRAFWIDLAAQSEKGLREARPRSEEEESGS